MKLVLLGDPHYPTLDYKDVRGCELRNELYKMLFQCMARENADAYIAVGDLTNSGKIEDLKEFLSFSEVLNAPFYFVLGNHDTHGSTKAEFVQASKCPRYRCIEMPQANLFFIDTTLERRIDDWIGIMDDEQYMWLKRCVADSKKPVFIIAHHPVENTTKRSDERKLYVHENMWEILEQKPGGVYINGHTHVHSIVKQRGWLFVQTGDLLSNLDYSVLQFDGENVTVTTNSLKDELVSADELTQSMDHYTRCANLSYAKEDLECTFCIGDHRREES